MILINHNKQKIMLMFLCFCLILVVALPMSAQNITQNTTQSRGLDFVVIVDQSGSMSGKNGPASDGLGVRNDMVKRTFQLLATDGVTKNIEHRFGVISFGDNVRVDLPLSRITADTVDRLQQRLNRNLNNSSMGYTHFLAAFNAARNMFENNTSELAEPGDRVVLLITDGAPYTQGINIYSYRENLRKLINSHFPHPAYRLYVTGLDDPTRDYWKTYGQFWQELSHNNALKLEDDEEEIFKQLHKVVGDILEIPGQHETGNADIVIPPYLESVVFAVFCVKPEINVKIYSADDHDNPISDRASNVSCINVGNTIRTVTVKNPKPGIWKLRKSPPDARVDVHIQKFFTRGKLILPHTGDTVRQFEKITLRYRVENSNHEPLEELPGYPLTLELSLLKPDGSRVQMKMNRSPSKDPKDKSIFLTAGEILCDKQGTYKAEVLIATKDLKSQPVNLFRDNWSKFSVQGATLIKGELLSPKPLENIPLYRTLVFVPNPVTFTFKFSDEDGNPMNLPALLGGNGKEIIRLFNGNENLLYGTVGNPINSEIGKTSSAAVPMTCTFEKEGILKVNPCGLTGAGTYNLKVRPNNSVIPELYTLRMNSDAVVFERNLSLLHWLQLIVLSLALLTVLGFYGTRFYLSLRFPLKGKLYLDRLGDRNLAQYVLTGRGHSLKLKGFPNETKIISISMKGTKDKQGGVHVKKVVGYKNKKKTLFLEDRILSERGAVQLKGVPYVLKYRLK